MTETRRATDPLRPEAPPRPGWQPDPWGDGERYWDGRIWTRQLREAGATNPVTDFSGDAADTAGSSVADGEATAVSQDADPVSSLDPGPRDWAAVEAADDDDARPFRSSLQRGMIWSFAVVAILALVLTALSALPRLFGNAPGPSPEVPQRSAHSLLYLTGSFTGSV